MSRIRSKDTKPERVVRKLSHALGCRFRLYRKDLPGKPDLAFPRLRKVILVHGCFWHMHNCKYGRVKPATNAEFWEAKRQGTVQRDRRNLCALRKEGWQVLIVWECWTRRTSWLTKRLAKFLTED